MKETEAMDEECSDYEFEPVFLLHKAMYVPHYINKHQWVTYGGQVRTTIELLTLGAKPETKYLWRRGWTEQEIFKKRSRHCSPTELKNMLLNQHVSSEPPKKGKKK
jgi:hypothetical protein